MLKFALTSVAIGVFLLTFGKFFPLKQSNMHTKNTDKPYFFVQTEALNLRNAPSLDAKILKTLPKNTKICDYSMVKNGFLHTKEGFVFAKFLHLNPKKDSNFTEESPLKFSKQIPNHTSKFLLVSKTTTTKETNPISQARIALKEQDYTKAKNLALHINQQDPKNLESWEIFAKSVFLEGRKKEAMQILQNFLRIHYDENLAQLLFLMQQGKKFAI